MKIWLVFSISICISGKKGKRSRKIQLISVHIVFHTHTSAHGSTPMPRNVFVRRHSLHFKKCIWTPKEDILSHGYGLPKLRENFRHGIQSLNKGINSPGTLKSHQSQWYFISYLLVFFLQKWKVLWKHSLVSSISKVWRKCIIFPFCRSNVVWEM